MLCEHQNTSPCFECDVEPLENEIEHLKVEVEELKEDRSRLQDALISHIQFTSEQPELKAFILRKQAEVLDDFLEWAVNFCSGWAQDDMGNTYWHDMQIEGFAQKRRERADELEQLHERQRDELAHRDNETERLRARVTELEGILYNANLQTDRLKRDYVTHKQAEAVVPAIMKAVEDFGHPDTTYSAARVYAEEYARDLTMKRRKR